MVAAILRWVKAKGGKSVTGEVADANLPSIALLRKFGFAEDRKTRYKKWGEETYFDAHYYKLNLDGAAAHAAGKGVTGLNGAVPDVGR